VIDRRCGSGQPYARIGYGAECQGLPKMKRVVQTKPEPWCPECGMEMALI
jgi:hypothetical protein